MLARSLQVPIGFASLGQGGSSTRQWVPTGKHYPLLVRIVKALGQQGARAVLWHEGYVDGRQGASAEEFAQHLAMTMQALDLEAGYHLPWVVAQEGAAPFWKTDSPQVREGQRLLWERGLAYEGPLTDDLVGPKFRHDTDHLNELGLRIHAERWFAMLWSQFFAVVPMRVRNE